MRILPAHVNTYVI